MSTKSVVDRVRWEQVMMAVKGHEDLLKVLCLLCAKTLDACLGCKR